MLFFPSLAPRSSAFSRSQGCETFRIASNKLLTPIENNEKSVPAPTNLEPGDKSSDQSFPSLASCLGFVDGQVATREVLARKASNCRLSFSSIVQRYKAKLALLWSVMTVASNGW
jgi:hypothetical protein